MKEKWILEMIFKREMDGKEKDIVWVITVLQRLYFRVLWGKTVVTAVDSTRETLGGEQSTFYSSDGVMNPGRRAYPIPGMMPRNVDRLSDWCPHQDQRTGSMANFGDLRRD